MTVDACMALETKATFIQGPHEMRMPTEQDGGLVSEVWKGKLETNDGDSISILSSTVPGGLIDNRNIQSVDSTRLHNRVQHIGYLEVIK
jgi:hypothetical protein